MSTKTQRTIVGIVLTGFVVLTIGVLYLQLPSLPGNISLIGPPALLESVPPSEDPPENSTDIETITVGPLTLNATGYLSGMIPHSGPITFHVSLNLNITNTGPENITDFHLIRMSLYYLDSELFYTFSFSSDDNITILAGEYQPISCSNNESHLNTRFDYSSPVYARILISFDTNQECILTTPTLEGIFAIE